jgi:hypothetical protein
MRTTAAPAFVLIAAGGAMGVIGILRDRRAWVRILCGIAVAAPVVSVIMYFGLAALPETATLAASAEAPDFTLPDHTGSATTLSSLLTEGPVMLVFYRGHW